MNCAFSAPAQSVLARPLEEQQWIEEQERKDSHTIFYRKTPHRTPYDAIRDVFMMACGKAVLRSLSIDRTVAELPPNCDMKVDIQVEGRSIRMTATSGPKDLD